MKHISKQSEPNHFKTWKDNNSSSLWEEFVKSNEYRSLKSFLRDEQEGRCCYCEIIIQGNCDTHIEHYKPKSKYPNDKYNYLNLLASCQHNDSCGHKKGKVYDNFIVSPFGDCESRFTYTGNGMIISSDENDEHAKKTSELLGLNCKRLRDLRNTILQILEDCDDSCVAESLCNCNEWFNGFYTVIQYVVQKRGMNELK